MNRTVLVVEDNSITRKMMRVALGAAGYSPREAGTGAAALCEALDHRPALVVLDYLLPDTDGITLLAELRTALGAPDLPAIVMTGMVGRLEELSARGGPHVQLLAKPVEPGLLIELVRAELLSHRGEGKGRRVLLVDDDPLTLKLAAVHFRHAGYDVETAVGGAAGLARAREAPPEAIVTDVLMPGLDGFALCGAVRRDPLLAHVPVVLVSASYSEPADHDLAMRMGASALVTRTGDMAEGLAALETALAAPPPAAPREDMRQLATLHGERLAAQLEQQTARNEILARQAAIQATALSLVRGLAAIIAESRDLTGVVSDVLVQCLDATGLSTGVLYLVDPEGRPRVQARFGIPASAVHRAENAFGEAQLLVAAAERGEPVAYSADMPGLPSAAGNFLATLGLPYALLVPFPVLQRGSGVLLLASDHHDLAEGTWLAFARSVAGQFGQTISLADSLSRLATSEARQRALMNEANDAILVIDAAGLIVEANRRASRLSGWPREDMVGRAYDELVQARPGAGSAPIAGAAADRARPIEEREVVRPDGQRVPVEVSAAAVRLDERANEPVTFAILRDLTERRAAQAARKEAESRLKESEEQYRSLFYGNPQVLWVVDAATLRFLAVNDAAVAHYGYARDAFLAMTLEQVVSPEDAPEFLADVLGPDVEPEAARAPRVYRHVRGDGTEIVTEAASQRIRFDGHDARMVRVLDVTEKRSLEAQLQQAQKMESVGRLAGGVAHDFNNILGVITGYGELLRKDLAGDATLSHYVDDILRASDRAAGLTRQLLAFSRRQVLQTRILDLNEVLHGVERLLQRLIGEDVRLSTHYAARLPAIRADAGQLEQVIMNLVVNARDAMPKGGNLILATSVAHFDARYAATHAGVAPGTYAMLAVSDTGGGMTSDVQAQIFEPFFTTKGPSKGTGLGLATVHGIVRQSGGHIFVYSEPGLGTTFKIYLPSVESEQPAPELVTEAETPGGHETVLVVEDEPSLRDIVCLALGGYGYQVLRAEGADAALRMAVEHAGPIDLLLTDLVMPGRGGSELAREMSVSRPDLRVLYMSGYTDDAAAVHEVLAGQRPLLEKPFSTTGLARKVREVLDGPVAPAPAADPHGGRNAPA